ncbi:MAG: DinB family protein, partial [Acidobacteriota bacterium]
ITTNDASHYPSFEEVSARYAELRRRNLVLLDSFSEADLDKPTPFQPTGLEEHFATYGRALLTLAVHQGQVIDAIRAAGRAGAVAVQVSATSLSFGC